MAKSSEARKCYDLGMFAESVQFCSMVEDDTRMCIQALRQAMENQGSEVRSLQTSFLIFQAPATSGDSSIEGSVNMEGTPPQMFTGVSPSSLKVFATCLSQRFLTSVEEAGLGTTAGSS